MATAVRAVRGATETWALGKKIIVSLRPQTTLTNDGLHALEPVGHGGMVFREIKQLRFTIWEGAAVHAWTVRVVHPSFLRSCKRSQSVNQNGSRKAGARLHVIVLSVVVRNEDRASACVSR